ncbi:MAG: general secretion pathway protein GspB [Elusimicrobia bacterium]|nr:general secretion pathway protein GspB [Elusimicrobiota bacterium]
MTNKQKLVVSTMMFIVSCVILVAIIKFGYMEFSAELRGRQYVYERFNRISQNLAGFDAFLQNANQQEARILELINQFYGNYMSNQEILHIYEQRVIRAAAANNVTLMRTEISMDAWGSAALTVDIESNFINLYSFLFDIEMFSQIIEVSVAPTGAIRVITAPILFSSDIDDHMSGRTRIMDEVTQFGYFEEIINRTLGLFNLLDPEHTHIPSARDLLPSPAQEPFYFIEEVVVEEPVVVVPVRRVPVRREFPSITLAGIMYDPDSPVAIVNGEIRRPGDTVNGARITRITRSAVHFAFDGRQYTRRMPL